MAGAVVVLVVSAGFMAMAETALTHLPRANARMQVDELNELLDLELPAGSWDTVGGLVYDHLGHVLAEGEELVVSGHVLRAEKVQGRRIGRVRISEVA